MGELASETRSKRTTARRKYSDGVDDDAIIEGRRTYSIDEKLSSDKFNHTLNIELLAKDVTLERFHKHGFETPILIRDKTGLGMRIPSQNFTINDVKKLVGSRRLIDVMDCETQQVEAMSMKEFTAYYLSPLHQRQLNVLSLEFSQTRLSNYVDPPAVVRSVDWINTSWPAHLRDFQTDGTNQLDSMMYPKVQKYCLMSVGGCYTDFHVDMGGTSVWYHILHGSKIFWLIPPTPANLKTYERWTRSGTQDHHFLGDLVDKCQRIVLEAGMTFFIPSGWIHAVKTPVDSLVFGGNFLHSYSIEMQLNCFNIENYTKVPLRFRYPFFKAIHWYTLATYLSRLTGTRPGSGGYSVEIKKEPTPTTSSSSKTSAESPNNNKQGTVNANNNGQYGNIFEKFQSINDLSEDILPVIKLKRIINTSTIDCDDKGDVKWINLSQTELKGLSMIVAWLRSMPPAQRKAPAELAMDTDTLLDNITNMLIEHGQDVVIDSTVALLASDGIQKLNMTCTTKLQKRVRKYSTDQSKKTKRNRLYDTGLRRIRCKTCEPCTRLDCTECKFCKDMKKHGGSGTMKQSCLSRQCIMPHLPRTARCNLCDGDRDSDTNVVEEFYVPENKTTIMECAKCGEMVHPSCFLLKLNHLYPLSLAVVNEDVASTWDCARCVQLTMSKSEPGQEHLAEVRSEEDDQVTKRKHPKLMSPLKEEEEEDYEEGEDDMPLKGEEPSEPCDSDSPTTGTTATVDQPLSVTSCIDSDTSDSISVLKSKKIENYNNRPILSSFIKKCSIINDTTVSISSRRGKLNPPDRLNL